MLLSQGKYSLPPFLRHITASRLLSNCLNQSPTCEKQEAEASLGIIGAIVIHFEVEIKTTTLQDMEWRVHHLKKWSLREVLSLICFGRADKTFHNVILAFPEAKITQEMPVDQLIETAGVAA